MSLARALKKLEPSCQLSYIGHKGDSFDSLRERYHDFNEMAFITAGKFRRYHGESIWRQLVDFKTIALNIRDFFRTLKGIREAYKALKQIEPNLVFSKGSFVAVPVGIAAHLQKIPLITHDSDAVPGLANKIIGRWAVVNAVGTKFGSYPYPKKRQLYTGVPIDENIKPVSAALKKSYRAELGLPGEAEVLLIGGAGLGSKDINNKIVEISADLLTVRSRLFIVHIAGEKHKKDTAKRYDAVLDPAKKRRVDLTGFTNEFYKYTGASDLVVTRGGATVLAELAVQRKAAIVIPAPFLAGGHQLKNAEKLQKIGAIEFLANDAPAKDLLNVVDDLFQNRRRLLELGEKFGSTAEPNAADRLAGIILSSARGKNSAEA